MATRRQAKAAAPKTAEAVDQGPAMQIPAPLALMTDELARAREVAEKAKEAYLKAKAEVRSLEDVIIGMEKRYQIPLDLRQPIKKITRVRKGKDGEGTTVPVK